MGLGGKSYVLLIFLRERLGRSIRSAVWEVFSFNFRHDLYAHYWWSDGGDRGSGRMASSVVRCYRVSLRLSSGLSNVPPLLVAYETWIQWRHDLWKKKKLLRKVFEGKTVSWLNYCNILLLNYIKYVVYSLT